MEQNNLLITAGLSHPLRPFSITKQLFGVVPITLHPEQPLSFAEGKFFRLGTTGL